MPRATFVYDGDCAFCTSCARFIARWVPTEATVVPWQFADLDALGLTLAECEAAVQWVGEDETKMSTGRSVRTAAGPDAIARLLSTSTFAWRLLGRFLALRPVGAAARPAYRWVARNRHRMPGGTAACALPQAARERRYGSPPVGPGTL
jgi:predicted DCC family thiol-disulfide oxidoreductase YuxK